MLIFFKKNWGWFLALMGIIIAILAWQFPKPSNTVLFQNGATTTQTTANIINDSNLESNNISIFKGSIFDLAETISQEPVMLKKEEMAQKNNGLIVKESGYLTNLSSGTNWYTAFIEFSTSSKSHIMCFFDKKWGNTLESINIPDKISFEGTINSHSDYILLDNCVIK
jgi:hypothetical protein